MIITCNYMRNNEQSSLFLLLMRVKVLRITIIWRQIVSHQIQNMEENNDIAGKSDFDVVFVHFSFTIKSHVIWLSIFNLIWNWHYALLIIFSVNLEEKSEAKRHNYLAKEIIIQWHLTFRINILQIPAETFTFETVSQCTSFAYITGWRFSSTFIIVICLWFA